MIAFIMHVRIRNKVNNIIQTTTLLHSNLYVHTQEAHFTSKGQVYTKTGIL